MATIPSSVVPRIELPREAIADFCRRWGIVRLEIFGSVLRDDFGPNSDVDFLYLFESNKYPGWEFVSLCEEMEQLIGRPIDMVSRQAIESSKNAHRKREILDSAQLIYAA